MDIFLGQEFKDKADAEKDWQDMGTDEAGDMKRIVHYGCDTRLFRTAVTQNGKELVTYTQATHVPRFGIDVEDMAEINEVSEQMAVKLEAA